MSDLVVERIESIDALAAIGPEWSALAASHGGGLPFMTFEWAETWWATFAARHAAVRDSLFIRAFRDPEGRLVGIAPLILVSRPGLGPALVRSLEFVGADPYVTEVRGVLAAPEWEDQVYRSLLGELLACAGRWDRILWRGIPDGGPGHQLLQARGGVRLDGELSGYRLPLPESWEAFKSSRPRNVKESLRRCYNSLERDGHAMRLEVLSEPAAVAGGMDAFLTLHAARAGATDLKAHGDVFVDETSRRFLKAVSARLAERDGVRLFFLEVAGQRVATRLGFSVGDTLYLYFSGYDPAWSQYSVMTTTVGEAIKHAIAAGYRWVHLSTGTDVSKTRWRPEQTVWREGVQFAPTWRGRLAAKLVQQAERLSTGPASRIARRILGRRR